LPYVRNPGENTEITPARVDYTTPGGVKAFSVWSVLILSADGDFLLVLAILNTIQERSKKARKE